MQLRHYLRMLQRGWWLIALTMLAALNVALVSTYTAVPLYRASAKFIVNPKASLTNNRDVTDSLNTLDKRSVLSTYVEVLNSTRIFGETSGALQLPSATVSGYTRTAVVLPDANVLELSVSGPDPKIAMILTNSMGQRAIEYIQGLNQLYDITFLEPAIAPTQPFSPQPLRDASLAVALGLVLGSSLAIFREQLRIPLEVLKQRNAIDPASSAYTRRYFEQMLETALKRSGSGPLSIGLVQLQGLQDLVEVLPPPVIQHLLHQVTTILRQDLRGGDIIGRWSDTSFIVALPATPDIAAGRTLTRIQESLSMPLQMDQIDFDLAPIVGAAARTDDETARTLIDHAEKALEQSRRKSGWSDMPTAETLALGHKKKGTEAPSDPSIAVSELRPKTY